MLAKVTDAEEGFTVRRGVRVILLLGGLATVVALVRQRMRSEVSSDNWVSSYDPGGGGRA